MPNYLIRVQLPDRPGALGAVASRIGSVGGDVVSIDILQRDNGAVVDELGVGLAGDHLLDLLRDEILEVDGVVDRGPPGGRRAPARPPRRAARHRHRAVRPGPRREALLDHLADRVRRSLVADFAAIIDADTTRVTAAHGDVPPDDELRAMALWAVAPLSSPVGADEIGTGGVDQSPSVAAAELVRAGVVLVVGRAAPVLRSRERQWIAIMAELADHGWRELA